MEAHPRPSEDALKEYYASADGWDRAHERREGEALDRWLLKRRRAFREEVGLLLAGIDLPLEGRTPRVLDYGCGVGILLDVFGEHGWETFGLEPAPQSAEIARARHTLVTDIPSSETFDLITAIHVFEHLPRPREVVEALARATCHGGHIYAAVPNVDRLAEHGLFRHMLNMQHGFAFSSAAMRSLLTAGGYRDVLILSSGPWEGVRDAVRSLRCLARKGSPRGLQTDDRPLDMAINALRAFGEQPAAREVVP